MQYRADSWPHGARSTSVEVLSTQIDVKERPGELSTQPNFYNSGYGYYDLSPVQG